MAATVNLTPVTLELGGKDPCIILPRTNIKKWSGIWMRGALYARNSLLLEHRDPSHIFFSFTVKLWVRTV